MKKLFLVLLLLISVSCAYSQSYIGFKSGVNVSSLTSSTSRSKAGYSIGGFYDKTLSDRWHFLPSLMLSYNQSASAKRVDQSYSSQAYSIETPLLMSYQVGDEDFAFMLDFGPYLRYGLFGKSWQDTESGRTRFNTFDSQKRFDVGAQGGFGLMMNQFYVNFSTQYGVLTPWKNKQGTNFNYNLTLGYAFELY